MGNPYQPGPNSRDKLAAATRSTYRVTSLADAIPAAFGAAFSAHPQNALHNLYSTADPQSAGNYDTGLLSAFTSGDPRLRAAKQLGRFDNHPGAQMQQQTAALRGLLAAILNQRGINP